MSDVVGNAFERFLTIEHEVLQSVSRVGGDGYRVVQVPDVHQDKFYLDLHLIEILHREQTPPVRPTTWELDIISGFSSPQNGFHG